MKDFVLKPGWWAVRALHEVAGIREVGKFTELSDDVFSLTMTGYRHAVAVWTVEDPAIVGTPKTVHEARDLFGRPITPIASPRPHANAVTRREWTSVTFNRGASPKLRNVIVSPDCSSLIFRLRTP